MRRERERRVRERERVRVRERERERERELAQYKLLAYAFDLSSYTSWSHVLAMCTRLDLPREALS